MSDHKIQVKLLNKELHVLLRHYKNILVPNNQGSGIYDIPKTFWQLEVGLKIENGITKGKPCKFSLYDYEQRMFQRNRFLKRKPTECERLFNITEPFKTTDEYREFEMNRLINKWDHALERYTFFLKLVTLEADKILKQPEFDWHETRLSPEIKSGLKDREERKKKGKLADWEQRIIRYS